MSNSNNECKINFSHWPCGYSVETVTGISRLYLHNIQVKYRNPYQYLFKLLIRYAKNEVDSKSITPFNLISVNDLSEFFGLPNPLAEEVLNTFEKEEYLSKSNTENKSISIQNKNQIFYQINSTKAQQIEEKDCEVKVQDRIYFFSNFPRIFIPRYLIGFNELKKCLSLSNPLDENWITVLKDAEKVSKFCKIPDEFIGYTQESYGTQKHLDAEVKVPVQSIPQDKEGNFIGIVARRFRFKWPEENRIITSDHPDYQEHKTWIKNLKIEEVFESYFPKAINFRYQIFFQEESQCWIFYIEEIASQKLEEIMITLEKNDFHLDSNSFHSDLSLKIPETFQSKRFDNTQQIKFRFKLQFNLKLEFLFLASFIMHNLFDEDEIDHSLLNSTLLQLINEFYETYTIPNEYQKYNDIELLKKQLINHYWEMGNYSIPYLFKYQEVFYAKAK